MLRDLWQRNMHEKKSYKGGLDLDLVVLAARIINSFIDQVYGLFHCLALVFSVLTCLGITQACCTSVKFTGSNKVATLFTPEVTYLCQ